MSVMSGRCEPPVYGSLRMNTSPGPGGGASARTDREDLGAGFCREHSVFEVGGGLAVGRDDRPPIAEGADRVTAEVHHRFDGERHPGLDFLAGIAATEV